MNSKGNKRMQIDEPTSRVKAHDDPNVVIHASESTRIHGKNPRDALIVRPAINKSRALLPFVGAESA